ncbi:hypothetical protein O988_08480 [Pseudogymnoascus sp. VKM F-3808]|nr:hypothetical protein O988_08480 [Pseudogymnoascus sp. VKM F-3808]
MTTKPVVEYFMLVLATSTMPVLTFSRCLLASAAIFWLVCLGADVACGLQKNPRLDPTAALCFFGAVAAAFIAGAVYGREAEYEKSQHKMESKQDLASQPLLDSEKGENDFFINITISTFITTMNKTNANIDINTLTLPPPISPPPSPSVSRNPAITMEKSAPTEKQQASKSAQPDAPEEDLDIDPEILAMLEEANQAYKEGLEEQEACNREVEEQKDAFDLEFEKAFEEWDAEHSGSEYSAPSVRSYGFASLPDEYLNLSDDDDRSDRSLSEFFNEIPPVGSRPILKPKTRVKKLTPAEKATAAMMPFTVSNPVNTPAITFPSNPTWGGDPIPSSGQQTLRFMGVTTLVPKLADTTNVELVNSKSAANTTPLYSEPDPKELQGRVFEELTNTQHELAAVGVRNAALEADVRRLEADRKDMELRFADLEKRLSEKLESDAETQMAVAKEIQISRNALTASQRSCNAMNKENGELRRQVAELANAANNLDKDSNNIRYQVSELSNRLGFVNGELDNRTRERDFAVQKMREAQLQIEEAFAVNNQLRQQIEPLMNKAVAKEVEVTSLQKTLMKAESEKQDMESNAVAKEVEFKSLQAALAKAGCENQDMENSAAAKEAEFKDLQAALMKAESEKQDMGNNAAAKEAEFKGLQEALTKAESEKQDMENSAAAKEVEFKDLQMALAKAESEKQDLELIAQEKEEKLRAQEKQAEGKEDKTTLAWEKKCVLAEEKTRLVEIKAEAYEQDYYDAKKQYNIAAAKAMELTDTMNELKTGAEQKKAEISQLTQTVAKLSDAYQGLQSSTNDKIAKLKDDYEAVKHEKKYIDGLLDDANDECTALNKLDARNKMRIEELEEALKEETDMTALLQERVRQERLNAEDELHGPRIADLRRLQTTTRSPRQNNRYMVPTLDKQLAAWKKDNRSSELFMEEQRRILKANPLTPMKPLRKPKDSSGFREETASDFDDSSLTAVERSVYSDGSVSEPDDNSESDNDLANVTYYQPDFDEDIAGDTKTDVVEKVVYVDKEVIVDKIIEHTVHKTRSPVWVFLYVYVDLWTIFAHSYPDFITSVRRLHPVDLWTTFAHTYPGLVAFIRHFHPQNIAGIFSSGIPSNANRLNRINPLTRKPMTIDIKPQPKNLSTTTAESQPETPTTAKPELPTQDVVIIHKLPPFWPNLITALLQLLLLYLLYESICILSQRRIWLSANDVTRGAVARFWGREVGFIGVAARPANWFVFKRLCFWMIRGTGYSFAIPG